MFLSYKTTEVYMEHLCVCFFSKMAPIPCPKCEKLFSTRVEQMIHDREDHRGEPSIQCLVCRKSFPYKSYLDAHMQYHGTQELKTCSQPGCGYQCVQKATMERHFATYFTVREEFVCRRCGVESCLHAESRKRHEAHCNPNGRN